MSNYTVNHKTLTIGEIEINFNDRIEKVIKMNDIFIILLLNEPFNQKQPENNVYAVDESGKILWQMQDSREVCKFKNLRTYVNIGIDKKNKLFATSFSGTVYYLDPQNGKFIGSSYAK